jgi:hypothetical protein
VIPPRIVETLNRDSQHRDTRRLRPLQLVLKLFGGGPHHGLIGALTGACAGATGLGNALRERSPMHHRITWFPQSTQPRPVWRSSNERANGTPHRKQGQTREPRRIVSVAATLDSPWASRVNVDPMTAPGRLLPMVLLVSRRCGVRLLSSAATGSCRPVAVLRLARKPPFIVARTDIRRVS